MKTSIYVFLPILFTLLSNNIIAQKTTFSIETGVNLSFLTRYLVKKADLPGAGLSQDVTKPDVNPFLKLELTNNIHDKHCVIYGLSTEVIGFRKPQHEHVFKFWYLGVHGGFSHQLTERLSLSESLEGLYLIGNYFSDPDLFTRLNGSQTNAQKVVLNARVGFSYKLTGKFSAALSYFHFITGVYSPSEILGLQKTHYKMQGIRIGIVFSILQ